MNLGSGLPVSCLLMTAIIWRGNPITMSENCPGSPYVNAAVLLLLSNVTFRWRFKRRCNQPIKQTSLSIYFTLQVYKLRIFKRRKLEMEEKERKGFWRKYRMQ